MKITTEDGIANPMPLSDVQEYNRQLKFLARWLKWLVIFFYITLITSIMLLVYLHQTDFLYWFLKNLR